jgi:hypothetical protein
MWNSASWREIGGFSASRWRAATGPGMRPNPEAVSHAAIWARSVTTVVTLRTQNG